jgi:hypothetical protein
VHSDGEDGENPDDCTTHEHETSDADILREVGMAEAADELDEELGGNF